MNSDNPYAPPSATQDADIQDVLARVGCCVHCEKSNFRVRNSRHPVNLHWLLNPILGLNELILGQRVPAEMYICVNCGDWKTPKFHFLHCPSCSRLHSVLIWSGGNAFRNWFGLVCPDCECGIPCIINLMTFFTSVILSPILLPLYLLSAPAYRRWCAERSRASRQRQIGDDAG